MGDARDARGARHAPLAGLAGLGRRVVAAAWAAALAPYVVLAVVVPVARALGGAGRLPVATLALVSAVAGALLAASVPRVAMRLPESLDDWPDHRGLAALWAVGSAFAAFSLARVAVFLGDADQVWASIVPSDPFLVHHSCLTAYIHGAILSMAPGANVYDLAFVAVDPGADVPLPPTAAQFAPFHLDAFGYPPPFLLLPRALLLLTRDFTSQRIVFGAASLALLLAACASAATTLGGLAGRRMWLLTPLFMGHPAVLATLQVGNFHVAAVGLCLLCWVALERRQERRAGVLLAVATLAKIFPGLLAVVLLVQRRWRPVLWTALTGAAVSLASVAVLGTKIWRDFLFYHLPKVQTGEALRFLATSTREVAFNLAPFGLPFKLRALGLEGWGWAQAPLFGTAYTVLLLGLAIAAARSEGSPAHRLSVWLAVVMLASLRSPYAAPFVLVTVVVLFVVLASEVRSRSGLAVFVLVVAPFTIQLPPGMSPRVTVADSLVRVTLLFACLVGLVLRREGAQGTGVRQADDGAVGLAGGSDA